MWSVIALFCNLTEPDKGACISATPSWVFPSREVCMQFAEDEKQSIPLDKVDYDYQCVEWKNKT